MCVQKNAESVYFDDASIQNLADDFAHVFRQSFLRPNALQFLFHQVLAVRLELVAEVERLHQAGGDLRVEAVDFDDFVGDEAVAAAVLCVEMRDVAAEAADERTGFVGVFEAEFRMLQGGLNLLQGVAAAA